MKFFPVALVQKSVPEIRGIFVVGSNLKVGCHDENPRISWYKILYQATEHSTRKFIIFYPETFASFGPLP